MCIYIYIFIHTYIHINRYVYIYIYIYVLIMYSSIMLFAVFLGGLRLRAAGSARGPRVASREQGHDA